MIAGNDRRPRKDPGDEAKGAATCAARWARVTIGGATVIAGGIVKVLLGVKAEGRQLEQVARPPTAVTTTRCPRAPLPKAH